MSSGMSDGVKGRVKEAAGALTGDKKLKRKGKADRPRGERTMSENASSNSTLYFLVGGLLVAVIGAGYFAMSGGPIAPTSEPDEVGTQSARPNHR